MLCPQAANSLFSSPGQSTKRAKGPRRPQISSTRTRTMKKHVHLLRFFLRYNTDIFAPEETMLACFASALMRVDQARRQIQPRGRPRTLVSSPSTNLRSARKSNARNRHHRLKSVSLPATAGIHFKHTVRFFLGRWFLCALFSSFLRRDAYVSCHFMLCSRSARRVSLTRARVST